MRIAFLGPLGTFSDEALQAAAPPGGHEPVPLPTIRHVVLAVERGEVAGALVPMENALEGAVDPTLDALAGEAPGTRIVGETVMAIRTCLIGRTPGLRLDEVRAVLSHPMPLAQCGRFVRERLPQAQVRAATSTAEAVREVAGADAPLAALGPRAAALRYGCAVLAEDVDDDPGNRTRFVWLARDADLAPLALLVADPSSGAAAGPPPWRTSVVFAGAGDRTPGWLVRCLSEFAFRGVNLTRIESRPLRGTLGHYRFFVDADGRDEPGGPVAGAVEALGTHCDEVRVLGSYPVAPAR